MPPLPKTTSTRARRNKAATAAKLQLVHQVQAPDLPEVPDPGWHEQTLAWWADVWASPMAPEYDDSDRHGLFILALLVDGFWWQPSKDLAAEIRLQRQCFGLTPIDRRRLQWEIERGEEAEEKRAKRKTPASSAGGRSDPRRRLSSA